MSGLPLHFVDLVQDALLKSFWRKRSLVAFLARHKVSNNLLLACQGVETKRELLNCLVPQLEAAEEGQQILKQIAVTLADQGTFPDLKGWEDEEHKIRSAQESVTALREYLEKHKKQATEQKAQNEIIEEARRRRTEEITKRDSLESLKDRLTELSTKIGTQSAGYEFESWFYDLVSFFEIEHRRPYNTNGRQIDGSLTLDGTTYLTELKFTTGQSDAPHVDIFKVKVQDKADNTMGIMVSMSGYSATAITGASGRQTPLILMDYGHIYLALGGMWTLPEIINRIRRNAAQTGSAFLPAAEIGN